MAAIGEDGTTASSIDVPGNAQALILGTWSGNPAVWVDCQDKILCVPLTGLSLGSPTSVDVLAGSTVTWVGGSPLMTMPSAQAAGVDAQGSYTVDVPSGYVATTADDKATALTAAAHLAQDAADLGQRAARPRQHPAQVVGPLHHHVHAQRGQVFSHDDTCHQRHGAHVGQTIGRQLAAQRGSQCMTRLRLPGLAAPPPAGRLFTGHQPYWRQRVLTFMQ